jgi:hypothetical protein
VAVLDDLQQAGSLSKADIDGLYTDRLIKLDVRILFDQTLELIESISNKPAINVFLWMRGGESLESFLRNVVEFTDRSFWERAVGEYDDKKKSEGLRPKKRARIGESRSAIASHSSASEKALDLFDDDDLSDILGPVEGMKEMGVAVGEFDEDMRKQLKEHEEGGKRVDDDLTPLGLDVVDLHDYMYDEDLLSNLV